MHSLFYITATLATLLLSPVTAYPAKEILRCRASPSTSAAISRTYAKGADIQISCQTTGTMVETSNVWDKTQHGCYVSDYYVKTGYTGIFKTKCTSTGGGSSSCKAPAINTATVNLIKEFEGFVKTPSPDPIGLPTVGYGHLCKTKGCGEVKYAFPLTTTTAASLLQDDVKQFASCISSYVNDSIKLNDNQYGALVSWAFNLGCNGIKSSILLRRLNSGESPNVVAAQELPKWNKAGSPLKVLAGLTRRRAAEVALFKKASSVQAHPPKC